MLGTDSMTHKPVNYVVPTKYNYVDRSTCFHVDAQHPKEKMMIERLSIPRFGTRSKRATTYTLTS